MGKEKDAEIKVDLLIEIPSFLLFPLSLEIDPNATQFAALIYHRKYLQILDYKMCYRSG